MRVQATEREQAVGRRTYHRLKAASGHALASGAAKDGLFNGRELLE